MIGVCICQHYSTVIQLLILIKGLNFTSCKFDPKVTIKHASVFDIIQFILTILQPLVCYSNNSAAPNTAPNAASNAPNVASSVAVSAEEAEPVPVQCSLGRLLPDLHLQRRVYAL